MKTTGRLFRRILYDRVLRKSIIWWVFLSCCLYMYSVVVAATNENPDKASIGISSTVANTVSSKLCSPVWVIVAFGAGLLFGMILWALWKKNQPNPKPCGGLYDLFKTRQTWLDCLSGLLFILLITSLFLVIPVFLLEYPIPHTVWWKTLLTNPGGPFALITGAATLVGTYIAVQSILEIKHTITSYEQLLDRLCYLIEEAHGPGDGVMYLTYSPLPGSWNVREKFKKKLIGALVHPEVKINAVCLNDSDHLDLLTEIAKKGTVRMPTITPSDIASFQKECYEIVLGRFSANFSGGLTQAEHAALAKKDGYTCDPIRIAWEALPSYYFFVSEHRAIVVMPIGLPQLKRREGHLELIDIPSQDVSSKNGGGTNIRVETLGFETTDRRIIELLQCDFEKITGSRVSTQNTDPLATTSA